MSYTNLNNPANYQLQSFGQDGMRTISTTQAYVEGEYYRVLVATEDSTLSATSMVGDDLASIDVYAGTTIYGLFTAVTVTAGEVTAYLAGRTDIDDVWAYIRAYGEANGATIEGEDCAKAAISPLLDKYYAQASLVMVPSLYKTSIVYSERPLSTDGELTFSRASSATRVGPDGYIEKVRTNLILQSQTFDNASWGKDTTTVTANAEVAPDGTLTAETMTISTDASRVTQAPTIGAGSFTASVYVKIISQTTAGDVRFLGVVDGIVVNVNFTPTNQWARYTATFTASTQITSFQLRGVTGGFVGTIAIWGFQLEAGDIATDYIPTTTVAVSVGPVANLPRLNYPINSDGSVGCPSLLLEPQTTALNQFSEQMDNAYWANANCTVTANQTASPSGYVDADLVLDNTVNNQHSISRSIAVTSGNKYTASFFLKAAGYTTAAIRMGAGSLWTGGTGPTVEFDLVVLTGTVVDGSGVTFTIEDYGNGWRRCSVTGTCVTSGNTAYSLYVKQYAGYIGNGTDGVYAWGANITATGYLQSYIPTLGASVTRGADACSKTGISSLIGQTEGTIFVEIDSSQFLTGSYIGISDGTTTNRQIFGWESDSGDSGALRLYGFWNFGYSSFSRGQKIKVALAYKNNDFALYVNGTQAGTNSGATISGTMSQFAFNSGGGSQNYQGNVYQTLLFKTRLTNAQLAELTTL
jgi:hypothetical protein